MNFITIDPHVTKSYAYSIWLDDKLDDFGHFTSMLVIENMLNDDFVDEIYIENQYLSKNFNTALGLAHNTGKIMGICEFVGLPCKLVNAGWWKSKIPELQAYDKDKSLSKHYRRKAKKNIMIVRAGEVIRKYYPNHKVECDEDIASAVLIGSVVLEYKGEIP